MAYNVSYTSLPTFTSNSIGYTQTSQIFNNSGSAWCDASFNLTTGVYIITGNVYCYNSPESYMYILSDNSNNNIQSIWFSGSNQSPPTTFSNFGTIASLQNGIVLQPTSYTSYFPIAGSNQNNGGLGNNSALSCSCTLVANQSTTIVLTWYNQSNGSYNGGTLTATRIS